MEIEGTIALVTGAASGIGRATAVALGRAGARGIVLADIDQHRLRESHRLVAQTGAEALSVPADVADLSASRRLFRTALEHFGRLDVVHNNAGLVSGAPHWPDTDPERMARVIDVNVRGTLIGTRLAVDALTTGGGGGGAIVNTASVAGLAPMPTDPTYAATKAAIISFTTSCAALAQSHGIRVNAVLPGIVDTPMVAKTGDGEQPAEWLAPLLAMIERLDPEAVAETVLDLVRDDTKAGRTEVVGNQARP